MAKLYVNDGGTWKKPKQYNVNDGGTWKTAKRVYTNDGGEWKSIYPWLNNTNKLDTSTWNIGQSQTKQGMFGLNGDGNKIIADVDPFGYTVPVWQTINNDTTSDGDGGWSTDDFPIDNTKTYRFSVWVKRKVLGNGSFYFGVYGFNGATNNGVYRISDGSLNTNHYFDSGSWDISLDTWYLLVAHMHPYSYTGGQHTDSGWYVAGSTTKQYSLSTGDAKWHSSTTSGRHRTYLYYSTVASTDQRWVYPRVDIVDGTEPSVSDLVNNTKPNGFMKTCKEWRDAGYFQSGVYQINPTGNEIFDAYCDMETDGGGWTLVFYSNSSSVSRSMIQTGDWNSGPAVNFSRLYSFKDIKNDAGRYEFFVHDSSDVFRHNIFNQTNSYMSDPNGNGYIQTKGNFYYSSITSGWRGLSTGNFGNSAMQTNCTLSMSYEGSSWTYCLQDQYAGGYNTGPWFHDGGYDVGSQQWVKVYQR